MFLPAILMTLYNSKMFHSSIASLFPVKHRHKKQTETSTEKRFSSKKALGQNLTKDDVQNIQVETKVAKAQKYSWLSTLFCCVYVCHKNRNLRLRQRQNQFAERQLDIRSLIQTRIDLNILIHLLLSQKQRLLFKHQHLRAIEEFSSQSDDNQAVKNPHVVDKTLPLPNQLMFKTAGPESLKEQISGQLLDYKIKSTLDQKLLLGIW